MNLCSVNLVDTAEESHNPLHAANDMTAVIDLSTTISADLNICSSDGIYSVG